MQTRFDHRENNFDALRMALALLVIASHCYPLGTGSILREPSFRWTHGQAHAGDIAVDLFFIISGFLITASYERSASLWKYLKKRVLRIYPGFIVAMLVGALVVLPCSGGHMQSASWRSVAFHFAVQTARLREFQYTGAFLHNPAPGVLNGASWSICYEFWCYLGVALLGLTGLLRSTRLLVALFLVSIVAGLLFTFWPFTIYFNRHYWTPLTIALDSIVGYTPFWARLLPMYLAGVVFYRLRSHLTIKPLWIAAACAALVAASQLPHGWPLFFPVVGAYLVLVLAFHPAVRLHRFGRYGDFSYGTYLYGFPIQQLIMQHFGHPVPPWMLFVLSVPTTLLCAVASWFFVERHFVVARRTGAQAILAPAAIAGA